MGALAPGRRAEPNAPHLGIVHPEHVDQRHIPAVHGPPLLVHGPGRDGLRLRLHHLGLIDVDSRQPLDLAELPGGGFSNAVVPDRPLPIKGPGRIRVKSRTPVRRRPTFYSDIDINGHVNSIRYIEMILDLFSKQTFDTCRVARIEMAYCMETYCGEWLDFYVDQTAPDQFMVEIRKTGDVTVVRAAVRFRPLDKTKEGALPSLADERAPGA